MAMSTEITYLAWSALLTGGLWIPYVIAQVAVNGPLGSGDYKDPTPRELPLWGQRAYRAHLNAVESFAAFAALILAITVTNSETAMTAIWAAVYFFSRLVHAVVYIAAIPYVRTVIFTLSFIAVAGLFWELVT